MDPGERGVELSKKITDVFGEGWSKRLGGSGVVLLDDGAVAITAGGLLFYESDGELWAQTRRDGRTWSGHWVEGKFEVVGSTPAPDHSRN